MSELRRMALLSIGAAIATLIIKFAAYFLTGSVSLFSDAAESMVNLSAGALAFALLAVASRPADDDHSYGHDKAEYFSCGAEGVLIVIAAAAIIYAAIERFMHPQPLRHLGAGLTVALTAAAFNFATARLMLSVARQKDSLIIEADARHLLADVWTTLGVAAGLGVVALAPPGWEILDPVIACLVGAHVVKTGAGLIQRSIHGLMDAALPPEEIALIEARLREHLPVHAAFRGLRTRKSGPRRFIEFSLLLPGGTQVAEAHRWCDLLEAAVEQALPRAIITIHVEPLNPAP